jgi:RNA polymerase sigma-70 factor (ECF subfamily)
MTLDVLGQVHREQWGRLLGRLIRTSGRPDLAEDALAEAFTQAAHQWPADPPANPVGWLAATAQRRHVDAQRSEIRRRAPQFRSALIAAVTPPADAPPLPGDDVDDRLALLFMATHPALADDVRPALALRFVLGVPTDSIAALFLVPTSTMAARLTRAKRRLAEVGAAFRVPDPVVWPDRVVDVARALYLAFTAAYVPGDDGAQRLSDASDVVRLTALAADLMPTGEILQALAALVQLHHARRYARFADDGTPVLLAQQNRARWRTDETEAALKRLTALPPTDGYAEELRLQALIAAFHNTAAEASETDWAGIARAYRRLEQLTGSPIVRLNRAVAEGEAHGAMAGLAVLRAVGERLPGHPRFELVRAELLLREGHDAEARVALAAALAAAPDGPERRHIAARLAALQPD